MPGFSTSNKLLQKYEQEKNMRLHKQRLHAAKTTIDSKSPKKYPHVILRLKRIQLEEEKQSEVDHENKLLLQKMTRIMKNKPVIDNWNEYEPKSLNYGSREKAYRDIHYQNIGIARRLEKAQPVYKTAVLENEYQKKRYLQALWAENAKDFIEVTPRHLKYRQLKRHTEAEELSEGDFESEDNSVYRHKIINRDSLPPIDNGKPKNIRYMKEGGEDSSKHKSSGDKLPKLDKKWKVQHKYGMYHDALESDIKQSEDGSIMNGGQTDRSQEGSVRKGDNSNLQKTQIDNDAKQLFNAAKLIGKVHPEDIMIRTLVRRSRKQRLQTKARFEDFYDLELIPELKTGLGSDWHLLIDALLDEKLCSVSRVIHDALEEGNYSAAVEVLCLCEPSALTELDDKYMKDYAVSVEGDIKEKTDVPEQTLLLALHKSRDETMKVNDKQAEKDAEELYESGDGRWSSETGPFIKMVNARNFAHIRAVLNLYRVLSGGKDVSDDVKSECTRQYADALLTMINFVKGSDTYFADKMFKIMSPKNPEYINMMVIHSEIDMAAIKRAYKKKYDAEMVDDMKHKCAGPTVNVLIELANKVPPGQGRKKKPSVLIPQPKRQPLKKPDQRKHVETEAASKHNPLAQPSPRVAAETFQQRKEEAQAQEKEKELREREKELKKDKELTKKNISGTVKPYKNFHPDEDCDNLRDAMGEYGTDEREIIRILSNRCNFQRQELKKVYEKKFKRDLMKDLQSQLQGDFEEIVLALMMTPTEYDAYCLHEAMDGLGTAEATLIGILATRDAQEKKAIAAQYQKVYNKDLEGHLVSETSGDFQNLLIALAKGDRDQGSEVNTGRAQEDAKKLYKEGQISIDPKDEVFIEVMVKRNHAQVKETFKQYEKLAGFDVYTGITNAMLGDAEDGYITLAKCIEDPVEFFAERLVSCFSGLGTSDNMLIRIVVSRSEIDLGDIKLRFEVLYKKSLSQVVGIECRGDYKNMLLAVMDDQ